jgi:intracellular sulfur oxidation DsrE/DsrF family protein
MDPKVDYNVVFDLPIHNRVGGKDSKFDSASINMGLNDIGRIYNLHAAGGVPKDKIHFVVAVHAMAEASFFTNEAYQKKYKMNNPNIALIEQLDKAGVRFLLCGQSHNWLGYTKDQLIPQAKLTVSAQTTLTQFQSKGYALKVMTED